MADVTAPASQRRKNSSKLLPEEAEKILPQVLRGFMLPHRRMAWLIMVSIEQNK